MRKSALTAALYLCLTFVTGAACGGFGFWLYQTRTVKADTRKATADDYRRRYLNEMRSRLKLNDEQVTKLATILDSTRTLYRELSAKHRPEYDAIHHSQVEQVQALLSEEQRAEYTKIQKERDERRKKGPPRGPGY